MSSIILVTLSVINIALSVMAPRAFIIVVLLIGEAPYGLMPAAEKAGFLPALGGFNISSMVELSVMLGCLLVIALNNRRTTPLFSRFLPHAVFLLFAALGILWSSHAVYGFRMLAKLAAPPLFLLACAACLRSESDVKAFEKTIIWSAFISLLLGFSNYFFKYAPVYVSNEMQYLTVPGSSPALFSFHISVAALLALGAYLFGKRGRHLFLALLFSVAVFMAFTRISMAGLAIALALLIILSPVPAPVKLMFPILVGCALITAVFVNPTMKARMFTDPRNVSVRAATSDPGSLLSNLHSSGRFRAWDVALNKFFYPSPVYGAGTGATQAWFYEGTRAHIGVLHSDYLRILCELGIVGLLLFGMAMIGYARGLLKAFKRQKLYDKKYGSVALACLVFYLITLTTDNALDYVMPFGNYVFCLIAISAFVQRKGRVSRDQVR